MQRILPIILICHATLLADGCSRGPGIPPTDSIRSIHVSLNDPANPAYWNYEGVVPKEHWPTLLKHFSNASYPSQVLNWQGLAVLEIHLKDGTVLSIEVYDSSEDSGCYKLGEYYVLDSEKQFGEDAKRFVVGLGPNVPPKLP